MPRTKRIRFDDLLRETVEELDRSINLPDIRNYVPYGQQLDFHESTKFGRILSAGNRAGKTDALVVDFIHMATDTSPYRKRPENWGVGPISLRILTVDINKGVDQIMLPKFKRWMTRSMLVDGLWEHSWDSMKNTLTFSNGSTLDFLTYGMTLDKHGGVPRHMIGFDEEPPQMLFNEGLMRLKDYDGTWAIAATPTLGMDWIYDLLVEPVIEKIDNKADLIGIFELDSSKNPYLQADDNSKFTIAMTKEEQDIRNEGKFVARSGLVFPNISNNVEHFCRADYFPDKHDQVYSSVDHGWNNPTAWLWHAVRPTGEIITFKEHYAKGMTVPQHAAAIHRIEAAFRKQLGHDIIRVGDPAMRQTEGTSGVSPIQMYSQYGIYIGTEIERSVEFGLLKMQEYFQDRAELGDAQHPDGMPMWTMTYECPNFIREMRKLRWASYESEKLSYSKNKQELVHKKDDHTFDSARYFATLMPDPRPVASIYDVKRPVTLSYQDMMVRLSADPEVEFADTRASWAVQYEEEDY